MARIPILLLIAGTLGVSCVGADSDEQGGSATSPVATPQTAVPQTAVPTTFEVCMTALPPLPVDLPLTEPTFRAADEALVETMELAEAGDVDGAEVAFFGTAHDLTHVVDSPLRLADEALAIRLCNEVVIMERVFLSHRSPTIVRQQAEKIRELLSATSEALDIESP